MPSRAITFTIFKILCCITGLFGVCQKRVFLLVALTISTVISICQNVLIFLWYIGIFGDISRPVLSAGLPYSYSFFLRHTPYCGAHFDLQKSKWVQSPCILPYNQIEAGQALLHVILAAITMILSIIVILERRREKDRPKMPLPVQYAQIKRHHRPTTSSLNDIRSGYTNSSYDDMRTVALPEHRIPPYPYERNNRNKRARIRPNSMPQPHFDQYSSVKSIDKDDIQPQPQTLRSSTTVNGRFRKSSEQPRRASMHEELRGYDGPNEEEFGKISGTMTSLVSFDPKSRTLLRVREHRESDDDEAEGYCQIGKESVPSFVAPNFHNEETPRDVIVQDVSSSDSGFPGSTGSDWPAASSPPRPGRWQSDPAPSWQMAKKSMISNLPGFKLVTDEERFSAAAAGTDPPQYKSNFRVEIIEEDRTIAVGHYHSINEFQITDDPKPKQTVPVITGAGLLV
ncbi:hypothetical protein NECAME_12167 [Necator americanus]|uniref:Sodium/potassium-transporting ATPase subunit beta-1-interacting protein n=1 Tax=Necator americanus TaxID=51031 RepID=W2T1A6_NECAM|nr:hypothetical protein NECAME_12167 [Necator americanus]ETN75760.1 hypothetical protein NECAME_12167 [Necator americanus]